MEYYNASSYLHVYRYISHARTLGRSLTHTHIYYTYKLSKGHRNSYTAGRKR